MGEAKRRRELGLPPKAKKEKKTRTNESQFSWSQFSINKLKSQYPAAPFVTTALFLLVLQLGFSLNSWSYKWNSLMSSKLLVASFQIWLLLACFLERLDILLWLRKWLRCLVLENGPNQISPPPFDRRSLSEPEGWLRSVLFMWAVSYTHLRAHETDS